MYHVKLFLILHNWCYTLQGWYIVTYAIGIFILNQFIAFLTPKIDPAMRDYEGKIDYVCIGLT